jgi:hypothetical protein
MAGRPEVAASPPEVDVVINNFNYGHYVCRAVDSALAQDHPRVHVVVVDDGSTDDSRRRLEPYRGALELVFKENEGQAAALNAGFARCRGDLVIFLDADDELAPSAASRAAGALAAEPDAARIQFRMALIDHAGRALGVTRPAPGVAMPSGDLRRAELSFPFDLAWVAMSGNAFAVQRLRRIMPIPSREYGRWGADWYLVHLSTLLGPVVSVDEVGAYYRVHGANAFEPAAAVLDLERIRREIAYQQVTLRALERLADSLSLERPEPILSLSNLACRMISHRLAPELHPLAGERRGRLLLDAGRAAARRFDRPLSTRAALVAALGAIAVLPPRAARKLAALLVFPQRRPSVPRLRSSLPHPRPRRRCAS